MGLFRFRSLWLAFALLVAADGFAGQASSENIKFGTSALSPTMAGVWMAKESGAFERRGLNAELVYISSGATAIQALVGGSVHAALGASNAVVAAILKGAPIIAVGSNTSRPGMQLWVHPEIQRAGAIAGKTLGDHPVRLDQRFRHAAWCCANSISKAKPRCASSAAWSRRIWVFARARRRDGCRRRRPGPKAKCWSTPRSSAFPFR